jgi:hypothetical protein
LTLAFVLPLTLLDLTAALLDFGVALAGTTNVVEEMNTNATRIESALSRGRGPDVIMQLPS